MSDHIRHVPSKASVLLLAAALTVTGCSSNKKDKNPTTTPSTSHSTPSASAPTFTAEQVQRNLVTAKDIDSDVKEMTVATDFLKERQAPMCSLTGAKLPGSPKTIARQFANATQGKGGVNYLQLIAHYEDASGAANAFTALQRKARSCPEKQHVPPKRIRKNFTLFAHDDTWNVSEDTLQGWTHLRGYEKHVVPPSQTKHNVYYFSYDYAVLGNLLVTTLYSERTTPEVPGDPSYKRSLALLTKQLQKIG